MKKFFFVLSFLFYCSISQAQDSSATIDPPKVESVKYTEKDIHVDSDTIEAKNFKQDFKKKYKDADFVYEYKAPEKGAWDYVQGNLGAIATVLFLISELLAAIPGIKANSIFQIIQNILKSKATKLRT